MSDNTFGKDFFISMNKPKNLVVVCKNPNTHLYTLEDMEDMRKRYLYEVGQKILTPFGIQTIKEIIYDYGTQHGYEWLILVEENKNQYKPCELIGIVVKTMSIDIFDNYINYDTEIRLESVMSIRLCNMFKCWDVEYISDLHKLVEHEGLESLWKMRNFGKKCMEEVQTILTKYPFIDKIDINNFM